MRRMMLLSAVIALTAGQVKAGDWTQMHPASSPSPRIHPAMAQLGDKLVLFGGLDLDHNAVLGDTWVWDGTSWTQITRFGLFGNLAAPPARHSAAMAYNPDTDEAILFGGTDATGHFLNDTWVFSFSTNELLHRSAFSWGKQQPATSPPARTMAVMEFDPNTRTILMSTGGGNVPVDFQDSWTFDSTTWTKVATTPLSPGRAQSGMAQCGSALVCTAIGNRLACLHVAAPSQVLLFGGENGLRFGDTWDFQGPPGQPAWTGPLTPTPRPAARFGHGMAYLPATGLAMVYGGQSTTLESDTWAVSCLDPSLNSLPIWGQVLPIHNPGARAFHGMATGPNGSTVVVFGGLKLGAQSNETWIFAP